MRNNLKIWVIVEKDLTGTKKQCLALARQLSTAIKEKNITLKWPWSWFSPYLSFGIQYAVNPQLKAPWPDMIIAAGRKSIAPALWVKKQSKNKSYVHFVQDPKWAHHKFNSLSAPQHDGLIGETVFQTIGALNDINKSTLSQAKKDFPKLAKLANPRIAVLIGGNSKTHQMNDDIIKQLQTIQGDLMITASRRTPLKYIEKLKALKGTYWNGKSKNPFTAYLAYADYILVTSDSVSMISEAIATGRPVYLLKMDGRSPKFDRFYDALTTGGHARWFNGQLENWGTKPLNETAKLAQWLKARYLKHVTKLNNKTDI
jgi:hypothetical protein